MPPPGAEAVGGDAVGRNVREMLDRGGSGAEFGGDGAGGDVVGNARSVEVAGQGALGWYVVLAEVKDTALGGSDGAESVIAGAAVAKGLASCGILLVGVGETDISPTLHVMRRALGGGSPLDGGIAEGGVSKAERFATAAVGGGGEGVLARSAKEVEPDGGEVSDGFGPWPVGVSPEEGGEGPEDGDVDRPDPGGSWVVIGPSLVEGSEPEDVPWPVQPWILEAQSGELLPDGT